MAQPGLGLFSSVAVLTQPRGQQRQSPAPELSVSRETSQISSGCCCDCLEQQGPNMLPDPPGEVLKCPQRRQWAAADFLRAKTERPCIVVTRKGLCPTGSVGEKIKLGSSSLMLNVGFTPLHGDPVAIPRSFLLAPVFPCKTQPARGNVQKPLRPRTSYLGSKGS